MGIRTLEQFKTELWDSWSEEERLNICYEVGKQLCELEEKIKERINTIGWTIDYTKTSKAEYAVAVLRKDLEFLKSLFEEKEDDY